jgi:predicted ATPase
MKRFILTGAPGSGKTAIIRQLELDGFSTVEEAATDIIALKQAQGIAQPWTHHSFIGEITTLQKQRRLRTSCRAYEVQFHDRSPVCTLALAKYLEYPVPEILSRELECIKAENVFEKQVLFIRNLGFITHTEARRITFDETLRFEKIHEEVYSEVGFTIVPIEPGNLKERIAAIKEVAGIN